MKKTIFYNNLSVYNILTESDSLILAYARNDELVKALEKIDGEKRFPMYFDSLNARLRDAVCMQKLRAAAAKVVEELFEFNDPFHVISENIVSYLNAKDLRRLQM